MSDEYLWDRSGEADAEIVRLEVALRPYAYRPRRSWRWLVAAGALAAGLALAGVWWVGRVNLSEWEIDGKRVAVGRTIEGKARLESASVGQVELSGDAKLQVLGGSGGSQRLALRRGTMRALIWAPPARFRVDTPTAHAIDLGCAYTLTVDEDGAGQVSVQSGWVAFQSGKTESFIPAGAICHTRAGAGPGLPYFDTASKELVRGVAHFEASEGRQGLREIVANAKSEDALTLWHLVGRTSGGERDAVVDLLAKFVPGLDEHGLKSGNAEAADRAWDLLGLGDTSWWRMWKREWRQQQ